MPEKAPEKVPPSPKTLESILKSLKRNEMPELPEELKELLRLHESKRHFTLPWDERPVEEQTDIVIEMLSILWRQEVRPMLIPNASPKKWVQALIPVAQYLHPVIELHPGLWKREDAVDCLSREGWIARWVGDEGIASSVAHIVKEKWGSGVAWTTYDRWRRKGLEYFLEGIHRALGNRETRIGDDLDSLEKTLQRSYPRFRGYARYVRATRRIIEDASDHFVGREFVFWTLADFQSQYPCGYLRVVAEAGLGKTAIAAELTRRHSALFHFFDKPNGVIDPKVCLGSLSAQVIVRYGLSQSQIPEDAEFDSTFLSTMLSKAMKRREEDETILIVIDALDAAEPVPPGHNWAHLPSRLPEGVYVIITQRPGSYPLHTFVPVEDLTIAPDDPQNMVDIEAYLREAAERHEIAQALKNDWPSMSTKEFVAKFKEASQGNFMYLRYVLESIGRSASDDVSLDLEELPSGLEGYYEHFWNQIQGVTEEEGWEAWSSLYRPIIGLLAVAEEPVTTDWLTDLTDHDRGDIQDRALARWSPLLGQRRHDGQSQWCFVHQSFSDFVAEKIKLGKSHREVASYYLENPQRWAKHDGYALRHLRRHLTEAEMEDHLGSFLVEWEQKSSTEAIVQTLIGLEDWDQFMAWIAQIVLDHLGEDWAEQLVVALGKAMAQTWRASGWLQGARAIAPILSELAQCERVYQVRRAAEQSLLARLPPAQGAWGVQSLLGRAIGEAFLALAPLTPWTVDQLWEKVYSPWGRVGARNDLLIDLAAEPGIARRLLENPGQLEEQQGPRWLWEVARTPNVSMETLIESAERVYDNSLGRERLDRLHAIAGAASTLGTEQAARTLAQWLLQDSQNMPEDSPGDNVYDRKKRLLDGLERWKGEIEALFSGLEEVMASQEPRWVWEKYLGGTLKAGGADAAALLASLAEEQKDRWTKEQQVRVIQMLSWGDKRVISFLIRWWHQLHESASEESLELRVQISLVLFGEASPSGVLACVSTAGVIDLLMRPDVSDSFRERAASWLRQTRYPDERVKALGQRWLSQGSREDRPALVRAGGVLADGASEENLAGLREAGADEYPSEYLCAIWRMGRREEVMKALEKALEEKMEDFDLIELVTSDQWEPALPLLLRHYLGGRGRRFLSTAINRYDTQAIDDCLDSLWETQERLMDRHTVNLLWQLGTPGAVRRALDAVHEGIRFPSFVSLPSAHREAIWPLLADFVDACADIEASWLAFNRLRGLWEYDEGWPWDVTACFFQMLEHPDPDIASATYNMLSLRINQRREIPIWQGRIRAYQDGLRELALRGTPQQRRMALRLLASMPEYLSPVLEKHELLDLLALEEVQGDALFLIASYRFLDLLGPVQALGDELREEAETIKRQAVSEGGLSETSRRRLREIDRLQQDTAFALARLEDDSDRLVQLAKGEGALPVGARMESAQSNALYALVSLREQVGTLAKAVQKGEAPEWWLTAAVASQNILLEDKDGQMTVRWGEKSFPVDEWSRL